MVVRTARPADAEAIERIRIHGWQVGYRHVFPAAELDAMKSTGRAGRNASSARRQAGRPSSSRARGARSASPRSARAATSTASASSYAIYVDPDEWSRGAGRALIARAEERLAEEYAEATLWVLEDNPRARRFYEAAGWRTDGARQAVERLGVSPPEIRYRKRLRADG